MDQRIYHGNIKPGDVSRDLVVQFNRGNLRVQQVGNNDKISVQIASDSFARSGGQTALTVTIQAIEDGVMVQVGQQAWLGVAASLGQTALATLINPLNLLNRIDDIAQDIESLRLSDEVWEAIEQTVHALGAGHELSNRLRRLVCNYCNTPNPVGESHCIACGAPLGDVQPLTCNRCGYVVHASDKQCPNCGATLPGN